MFLQKSGVFLHSFLILVFLSTDIISQTPCENGSASRYPCSGVDLVSRVTPQTMLAEQSSGSYLSDIWGWTDESTGKEYAVVCLINGTSFVDISDPINPVMLGILPEHHEATGRKESRGSGSVWRDVKVFQNYAYIISEDQGHGMQVFDMHQLRDVQDAPVTFSESAHYEGISSAHNIVINEETGFAYAVGSFSTTQNCNAGGLHMIDINDPLNPTYAGCYNAMGYTHDAQCVIYNGPDTQYTGREICFNANEDDVVIVDVTSKTSPQTIRSVSYNGAFYVHQGWLTEDHKWFISNDELDELNTGGVTKTFVWDVSDLDNPSLFGIYNNKSLAIDHNHYVHKGYLFQSNYSTGLRILDARDIQNNFIKEVAYFDTYIVNNSANFNGSWSNYPFFESGNVIVSDRQSGLFVLKPSVLEDENPDPGTITSIDGFPDNAHFGIYPNPALSVVTLDVRIKNFNPTNASIIDVNGRLIYETKINSGPLDQYTIDLSQLVSGIYQLRITDGKSVLSNRLVKI